MNILITTRIFHRTAILEFNFYVMQVGGAIVDFSAHEIVSFVISSKLVYE